MQLAFKHDPRLLSFDPEIHVDHGVVTLTGEVSHLTAKKAAERDARQTIGVRRVKNNLRTCWPDQPPSDEQIADFTRQVLARDPYVEKHNIVVECENAHASLYGFVDTEFEKEHAVWTASCQKGVVHVNDYLAVPQELGSEERRGHSGGPQRQACICIRGPGQPGDSESRRRGSHPGRDGRHLAYVADGDGSGNRGRRRRPHNLIEVRYGLPSGPHYYGPHNYVPR